MNLTVPSKRMHDIWLSRIDQSQMPAKRSKLGRKNMAKMDYKFINHTDPFLAKVIALGKKNSQTLGLMPKDAYIQQARQKCILIAVENDQLLGFCLFRVVSSKRRIGITQVCIDQSRRKQGIARFLLNQVRDKYKTLLNGMLVSCREDYHDACNLWLGFGFIKKKRVRSRSVEEKYLFKFWYSFGQQDLFSIEANPNDLRVVLDLNILIKLRDQNGENNNEEIAQLLSDWLTDEVDYYYAKETLNEIHRDKDFQRTNDTIQFLDAFQELPGDLNENQKLLPLLKKLHPGETENHISDRKQLAECKINSIPYFITIDEDLISRRVDIYDNLGVSILRPGEFILEIDELKNRKLYEPIRLQGAQYEVKRIDSNELLPAIDLFLKTDLGEKKSEFKNLLLPFISDTKNANTKGVKNPNGDLILLYGVRHDETSLHVAFIRIREKAISNTLFNQILVEVIREAVSVKKSIVRLSEKLLSSDQIQILIDNGFYLYEEAWTKIALSGSCRTEHLISTHEILKSHPEIPVTLLAITDNLDPEAQLRLKLDIERKLWPLKLTDLELPVFIVPIKPYWASQLFDYLSSNTFLFGSPPELSWSKENVYYRSFNPNVETFPARILWYASQEKGFERQKAIVGCSYLNNVVVGEAKQLFTTYRRFGIYKWPEIMELAKGDPRKKIKALQFSDTEVFQRPLKFGEVNNLLLNANLKSQTFVSPVKVNNEIFNKIYSLSTVVA
jgi:predicted nucleic acid-binding protein/GNAT superfamily N-acetyltransferase